jgi:hypothetical protein
MSVDQQSIYTNINGAVATSLAAISTVGTLQDQPPTVLAPVNTALQDALDAINSGIAAFDADISLTSVGGVIVGPAAPDQWVTLLNQETDFLQESTLVTMRGYLGRALANVTLEPS